MRPLTSTVLTPACRHARSRFGQISVSIMMNSRGFTSRSVRRTMNGEIERKVEHLVDVRAGCSRDLLPGHRRRRQENPQPRVALAQLRQQRARGQHLADRHGVDPDRLVAVEIEGERQVAEPLRQVARCTSGSGSPDTAGTATPPAKNRTMRTL